MYVEVYLNDPVTKMMIDAQPKCPKLTVLDGNNDEIIGDAYQMKLNTRGTILFNTTIPDRQPGGKYTVVVESTDYTFPTVKRDFRVNA
jgi:hypothetical protein